MTFEEWAAQPFGKMLGNALWERRMQQTEFADLAGVKTSSVSRWINGKGEPDLDGMLRACAVLPELQSWFNVQIHARRKAVPA